MRKLLFTFSIFVLFIILTACGSSDAAESGDGSIKIGVTGGPPEEITKIVQAEAEKEGIEIEVIAFNDFVTPNRALNSGELNLNMFQTKQFLAQYLEDRNDPLVPLGTTYNSTVGIFSDKYGSVDEIPDGATLGIGNDPNNRGRSLLLYEEAGLIKVDNHGRVLTVNDVIDNPKNFEFIEIEMTLMLSTLNSIDAGTVGSTQAYDQGIDPVEEAIYIEIKTDFPMVVAAREEDKENETYKRIVELYHSDAVREFIDEKYKDVIIVTDDPFELD